MKAFAEFIPEMRTRRVRPAAWPLPDPSRPWSAAHGRGSSGSDTELISRFLAFPKTAISSFLRESRISRGGMGQLSAMLPIMLMMVTLTAKLLSEVCMDGSPQRPQQARWDGGNILILVLVALGWVSSAASVGQSPADIRPCSTITGGFLKYYLSAQAATEKARVDMWLAYEQKQAVCVSLILFSREGHSWERDV